MKNPTLPTQLVLIGNYRPDGQQSMERFAQLLQRGFAEAGLPAEIWRPPAVVGRLSSAHGSGLGKWLGYVDKWLIFPLILCWRQRRVPAGTYFHICDHSNAPYRRALPPTRVGITCHDVLAIRGALGHADAFCPATPAGTWLQRYILHHLQRIPRLAAVSGETLRQLRELSTVPFQPAWRVIYNGQNADFYPMNTDEGNARRAAVGLWPGPYILHVGSNLARKNRRMLLDMCAHLGDRWSGQIVFAGKGADAALLAHAQRLGLRERVVSVVRPDHATLVALYSGCTAFIFPSFSEGFGWPVIEAQACGAPVITSQVAPMPEVAGSGACCANPHDPTEWAAALLSLQDAGHRAEAIGCGLANVRRFDPQCMMAAYLDLYGHSVQTYA